MKEHSGLPLFECEPKQDKKTDDGLSFHCALCETQGFCSENPREESIINFDQELDYSEAPVPTKEDEESSNRIADFETRQQQLQKEFEEEQNRPATEAEIAELLRLPDDEDQRKAS